MAIMNVTYMSSYLNRYVDFKVILPIENTNPQKKTIKPKLFKTLYLLHGFSGNCDDWTYGSHIFKIARDRNLAVIMPSGENSFYVDQEENGLMYGSFVGKELVEMTRKMFPLSNKREDTFIGGLSMGGFGSLLVGSRFADTFGGIIALSGPIILPNLPYEKQIIAQLPVPKGYVETHFGKYSDFFGSINDPLTQIINTYQKNKLPRLYIACGKEDFVYNNVLTYCEILKEKGVPFQYEEGSGEHEWTFWDEYIEKAIDWYLGMKP